MEPKNISSVLICGEYQLNKNLLLKFALHWAENGYNILYISNAPISSIPNMLKRNLVKETMKRIIFMYFESAHELLSQCVALHDSSFVPNVIIIDVLDYYCKLNEADFSAHKAALICAALLCAATTCAKRTKKSSYLITACKKNISDKEYFKRVKLLSDLYFFRNFCVIENENDIEQIFNHIINLQQYS